PPEGGSTTTSFPPAEPSERLEPASATQPGQATANALTLNSDGRFPAASVFSRSAWRRAWPIAGVLTLIAGAAGWAYWVKGAPVPSVPEENRAAAPPALEIGPTAVPGVPRVEPTPATPVAVDTGLGPDAGTPPPSRPVVSPARPKPFVATTRPA